MSIQNQLETHLAKNLDDLETWQVYADYLQTQGNNFGETIQLNLLIQEENNENKKSLLQQEVFNISKQKQKDTALSYNKPIFFQDSLKNGSQGPTMAFIPQGLFIMGSPITEKGRKENETQHLVKITKPFAIACSVIDYNFYKLYPKAKIASTVPKNYPYPVNFMFKQALAFSQWLSLQTGFKYRLAYEAEWEYAARAGTQSTFWWGEKMDDTMGNFTIKDIKPIDSYPTNPWGLYHIHGNVGEWVQDSFAQNIASTHLEINPFYSEHHSKTNSSLRVIRGGGCVPSRACYRSASRNAMSIEDTIQIPYLIGLRLVREL